MKKLISCLLINLSFIVLTKVALAARLEGGRYTVTRTLVGTPGGTNSTSANGYSASYAAGETVAAPPISNANSRHGSGYYAGWVGSGMGLIYVNSQVPASGPILNGIQLGVGPTGALDLTFSDQLDALSIIPGIKVTMLQDNLGHGMSASYEISQSYEPSGTVVSVLPKTKWRGNSIFELVISPELRSLDGLQLENPVSVRFLTLLDPSETNVVMQPIDAGISPSQVAAANVSASQFGSVSLKISPQALTDNSMILLNSDPQKQPSRIDPAILEDANRKATRAGGAYMVPLSIQEINAYSHNMQLTNQITTPATLSMSYSGSLIYTSGNAAVRSDTLSLWALDEEHHLWVQMPNTQNDNQTKTASANIPKFGVFAIMGQASGNAQGVTVFPNPWRPHGPHSGSSSGQTGTLSGGITFSNLPSECSISIYTVSGEQVIKLQHSDLSGSIGQERWLGTNSSGDIVASGVYLWRISSASDSKTGKLVIIR